MKRGGNKESMVIPLEFWEKNLQGLTSWAWLPKFWGTLEVLCEGFLQSKKIRGLPNTVTRKRAEYCFESTVSDERELTEFCRKLGNSVGSAKNLVSSLGTQMIG